MIPFYSCNCFWSFRFFGENWGEGTAEKGEPVYIDTITYEDFMLLGQVDMEKRFMDLDGLEQQEHLNEDMESGLELEYAFDMENETTDSSEENAGILCNRGGRNSETAYDGK